MKIVQLKQHMKGMLLACGALALAMVLAACAAPPPAAAGTPAPTAVPAATAEPSAEPTAAPGAGVQTISPEQALDTLGEAVLLDVRTTEEYEQGHIPGAYLIPVEELEDRGYAELPKDSKLYVYCRTGRRSAIAASTLASMGFDKVYDLGGIVDWPYETEAGEFERWDLNSVDFPCIDAAISAGLIQQGEVIPDDDEAEMPDLCGTGSECE